MVVSASGGTCILKQNAHDVIAALNLNGATFESAAVLVSSAFLRLRRLSYYPVRGSEPSAVQEGRPRPRRRSLAEAELALDRDELEHRHY